MSSTLFSKSHRILKKEEFSMVLDRGVRIQTKHFLLFCLSNLKQNHRLGIIVTKKVANSVKRNRVKRVLREYFRRCYSQKRKQNGCHDVVFIARRGSPELNVEKIQLEVETACEKHFYRNSLDISKNRFFSSPKPMSLLS